MVSLLLCIYVGSWVRSVLLWPELEVFCKRRSTLSTTPFPHRHHPLFPQFTTIAVLHAPPAFIFQSTDLFSPIICKLSHLLPQPETMMTVLATATGRKWGDKMALLLFDWLNIVQKNARIHIFIAIYIKRALSPLQYIL